MVSESHASARSRVITPSIAAAVAAVLAGSFIQPAFAQNASADEISEVVVTGSRITRRDNSADSPIVTVSSESLINTSEIGVEQALNKMPQFVPGRNQFGDSQAITVTPRVTPGIATANLRGLGDNRTLVLLDGRRTQPANATMVVDLNTIPSAAIDNVEVITGGAGSTYGADAVAGVVNFKLKRNYQGLTLDAQAGQNWHGDGDQRTATALLGANFDEGRGNAMIGISWSKRDSIRRYDRDFFAAALTNPWGTAAQFNNFPGYVINAAGQRDAVARRRHLHAGRGELGVPWARATPRATSSAGTTLYFNPGRDDCRRDAVQGGPWARSPAACHRAIPARSIRATANNIGVNYVYGRYGPATGHRSRRR